MLHTITWDATLTALSSISHGGETRGTITLLRRERVLRDGAPVHVPVISGNAWRGRLRRTAEDLYRQCLGYEAEELPLAAVHTLRTGGSLAKTGGSPLTGSRLRTARDLIPPLAIFGGATGGRTIEGALQVGKLLPVVVETAHLTGHTVEAPDVFAATQLETYTRQDESTAPAMSTLGPTAVPLSPANGEVDLGGLDALPEATDPSGFTLFRVETFPAGSVFSSWLRAHHLTGEQLSFLREVLATFAEHGTIGGRGAIGHGALRLELDATPSLEQDLPDWRPRLLERRAEVIDAIRMLT